MLLAGGLRAQARLERLKEEAALAQRKQVAELEDAHAERLAALRKQHREAEDKLTEQVGPARPPFTTGRAAPVPPTRLARGSRVMRAPPRHAAPASSRACRAVRCPCVMDPSSRRR